MPTSLGLVLLDSRYQVVYANHEALSALAPLSTHNSHCANASVMQNLQEMILLFATEVARIRAVLGPGRSWESIVAINL